jgi:hypothetical protein
MDKFSWTIDANDIDKDFDRVNIEKILVKTSEIDKFLTKHRDTNKYFVIGPKGIGKTLLLKLKSKMCRDIGYQCIPKTTLCEKLTNLSVSLSADDLNKFKNKATWEKIWELAIYILILRRFEILMPKEIVNTIGEECEDLWSILFNLLQRRNKIDEIHSQVGLWLRPKVLKLQQEINVGQVAIFIDNIDEAFDTHVGNSLKNAHLGTAMLDERVWINAQTSILSVARSICQSNPHIHIYLAIRSEAYNNYNEPLSLQLRDNCIFLEYTKEEVKDIFLKNIKDTSKIDLCEPNNPDLIRRLAGIDYINNRFVVDQNGEKVKEHLFDFIYRHTFGRPREIVEMGKNISEIPVGKRTEEAIYNKINEVSKLLFEQLKRETIPFFREDVFREFCFKIETNIFSIKKAREVFHEIREEFDFDNVNSYLYRLGILGVPKYKEPTFYQSFLPVAQYSLNDTTEVPEFQYFFLHPATYSEMKSIHMSLSNFFNQHNIVGYDQVFDPPLEKEITKHIHLGIDRDCLSIIIPEIYPVKHLSIYLRPNQDWNKLDECGEATFRYEDKSYRFLVYNDRLSKVQKEEVIKNWKDLNIPTIFYSKDRNLLQRVIHESEVITLSNLAYLDDLIRIDYNSHLSKQVYFCQRNINTNNFNKLREKLHIKNPKLKIDKTILDRFLYRYSLSLSDNELVIYVQPEEYSLLICMERYGSSVNQSLTVRRPNNNIEFKFLFLRQKYLVEGLYQFYKILKQKKKFTSQTDYLEVFNAFTYIQKTLLAEKFTTDQINNILGFIGRKDLDDSLNLFAKETLVRLDKLFQIYNSINKPKDIFLLKKSVFPSDQDFYSIISGYSNYTLKNSGIKVLFDTLEIKEKAYLCTIFISYSFKDTEFVTVLADKLIIRGIKLFVFQYDDPLGKLEEIMSEKVQENDKVLFVASENSIKSTACQYELSQCINKYKKTWTNLLIPIRLDDYIFKVNKHDIPDEYGERYWENIGFIKRNNVKDFSLFVKNPSDPLFDAALDDIVSNCKKK